MKRKLTITGIVVGGILALGPLWGILGTVYGMQRAFATLGRSDISDPHALSFSIGVALHATTVGMIACPIGIALCIYSIIKFQALRSQPPPLPPATPGAPISKA